MYCAGVDFGVAFEIPDELEGKTFFAAVVLKVKHYSIYFVNMLLHNILRLANQAEKLRCYSLLQLLSSSEFFILIGTIPKELIFILQNAEMSFNFGDKQFAYPPKVLHVNQLKFYSLNQILIL